MPTGVHSWSTTAASNANADEKINWAEGMAPSAVNDSARAEMASVAKFYADINGSITTGGTSSAYTVSSNQGFASLTAMNNAIVSFVPHASNAANPTLSVDGLAAKPIRFTTGGGIPSLSLIQGTPYLATYFAAAGEFILYNIGADPFSVPLGSGVDFWGTTAPNSAFVFPYGQAISRTTYSALFSVIGTGFGSGDGSTTFNLPDCRGRVTAKKDDMGGSNAGRLPNSGAVNGAALGYAGGSDRHQLTPSQNAAHWHNNVISNNAITASFPYSIRTNISLAGGGTGVDAFPGGNNANTNSFNTNVTISNETAGGDQAHNNVQPTIVCNYILRVI